MGHANLRTQGPVHRYTAGGSPHRRAGCNRGRCTRASIRNNLCPDWYGVAGRNATAWHPRPAQNNAGARLQPPEDEPRGLPEAHAGSHIGGHGGLRHRREGRLLCRCRRVGDHRRCAGDRSRRTMQRGTHHHRWPEIPGQPRISAGVRRRSAACIRQPAADSGSRHTTHAAWTSRCHDIKHLGDVLLHGRGNGPRQSLYLSAGLAGTEVIALDAALSHLIAHD